MASAPPFNRPSGSRLAALRLEVDKLSQRVDQLALGGGSAPDAGQISAAIESTVARYFRDHPVRDGRDGVDVTPEQIAEAISAYLEDHPIHDGEDGANATPQQIAAAVRLYLEDHPVRDGEDGADATPAQVAAAVARYMADHPVRNGADATPEQIANAVADYLDENPIRDGVDGVDGKSATPAQIAAAVDDYFVHNPVRVPQDGRDPTPAEIALAVATYLAANPPRDGKDATPQQIATAVAAYLNANPPAPGKPGPYAASDIGSITFGQSGLVQAAGVRRLEVVGTATANPGAYAAKAGDLLVFIPTVLPAGYLVGPIRATADRKLEVTLYGPVIAVAESYSITGRVVRIATA